MTTSAFTAPKTFAFYGKVWRNLLALGCFVLLLWGMAHAETAIYKFDTPEQERLFYELTAELRCPQCQNNNIAESNAGLSADMRTKVYELVQEGQSKKEIVQYMVDRYGNFITYDPPVTPETIILWIAPIFSLLIGVVYIIYRSRKSATQVSETNEEEKRSKTDVKKAKKKDSLPRGKTSYAFITVAVFFLLASTSTLFYVTTDWNQIDFEKKSLAAVPELKERYLRGDISSVMQVQQLAIGLRSQLLKTPDNAQDWRLLGEIYDDYMMKPDDALRALEYAYHYDPNEYRIKSLYGQLLLRTSPDQINRQRAVELLNSVLSQKPDHLSSLYWLALYSQSEQQYMKSIGLWERILSILPPSSADAKRIREHLENDKQAYEQQLQALRQ